jgi:hypothetical protein
MYIGISILSQKLLPSLWKIISLFCFKMWWLLPYMQWMNLCIYACMGVCLFLIFWRHGYCKLLRLSHKFIYSSGFHCVSLLLICVPLKLLTTEAFSKWHVHKQQKGRCFTRSKVGVYALEKVAGRRYYQGECAVYYMFLC